MTLLVQPLLGLTEPEKGERFLSHVSFDKNLPFLSPHSLWGAGLHTPSSKMEITQR